MFVPACPPGLFTKQFSDFAPSQQNVTNFFSVVTPQLYPGLPPGVTTQPFVGSTTTPTTPFPPTPYTGTPTPFWLRAY